MDTGTLRRRFAEVFFTLDDEKLVFRSATLEAICLASCILSPMLIFILSSMVFTPDMLPQEIRSAFSLRAWFFFLSFAAIIPALALFWGTPAAVLFGSILSFFFLIWILLTHAFSFAWASLAVTALIIIALRTGEIRQAVDGALAFWKLRLGDLQSARNVFLAEMLELEQRKESLELLTRKISKLSESSSEIERSLALPQVAEAVTRQAREMFGRGRAMVYKFTATESVLLHSTPPLKPGEGESGEDFNPISRLRRENILISDISQNYQTAPVAPSVRPFQSIMLVPLVTGNDTWGVLRVEADHARDFDRDNLRALAALAIPSTLALQNADLFAAIEQRAVTDGLTGLYRRHFLEKRLEAECSRARRNKAPLSLIFFDVDHFKSINDRFGHGQGDTVLRAVAGGIRDSIGGVGLAGRYGGEEFVALLPDIAEKEAVDIAERTRQAIAALVIPGFPQRVTISAGVAVSPTHAVEPKDLTDKADGALYESKRNGRNRVTIAVSQLEEILPS